MSITNFPALPRVCRRGPGVATVMLATSIAWVLPIWSEGNAAYAGLYDSDATSVTGGELKDRDYWRASWDAMQLEEALKERQPEGAVLLAVISELQLLDELEKTYPNDNDLKKWQARAQDVQAKIDPNANRSDAFKPGSLWAEGNYKEAYVNYHYAKVGIAQQDWAAAHDGLRYAEMNLVFLRERIARKERVSAWPEGAAQWVADTSADVAKLNSMVDAKLK